MWCRGPMVATVQATMAAAVAGTSMRVETTPVFPVAVAALRVVLANPVVMVGAVKST